jgi:uncharacterized protein (TIGR03086 family)
MSTQPLQQAIASTRSALANVTPDQLQNATPCASWDVAALINHIVGGQHFFVSALKGEPPADDATDFASGDFLAAFDAASSACLTEFGREGVMDTSFTLPFGEMPGAALMGLVTTDTFQHGWDLSKATGQPSDLAPELAAGILAQCQQSISDAFRGPEGAPFGPAKPASDDAPAADRLAAFLGREV